MVFWHMLCVSVLHRPGIRDFQGYRCLSVSQHILPCVLPDMVISATVPSKVYFVVFYLSDGKCKNKIVRCKNHWMSFQPLYQVYAGIRSNILQHRPDRSTTPKKLPQYFTSCAYPDTVSLSTVSNYFPLRFASFYFVFFPLATSS